MPERPWWRDAVIYQVYLRSFQDGNGDGIGDLRGVMARLDHLVGLGVDALWLTPFHPSPLLDGGYDVADFTDVDPRFGDLALFDRLVAAAHGRGLRVVMDFVPNHTSDRHPWFAESRSSRENPKRDWYVWRDGAPDGAPPSNWRSMLEGPAWTQDSATGQFYYHAFLPEQPDLDWRNPDVRAAMRDVLAFWLRRGVDGVRVDAVPHLVEDAALRDDLPDDVEGGGMPVQTGMRHVYTSNRPENIDCMAELREVVDAFDDRLLVGEVHLPVALTLRYLGRERPALHMPFNFALIETAWDARGVGAAIDEYLALLPQGAPPNWVLGNHDEARAASRLGPAQARVAAVLALTLGGTVFLYGGDELGLEDVPYSDRELRDIPEMRHPGHARKYAPHRSPMPWDASPGSGFTTGRPWLPVGRRNAARHATGQIVDPTSTLSLYRRLLALRRDEPALREGRHAPLRTDAAILAFLRELDGRRVAVAANFSHEPRTVTLPEPGRILLSTARAREGEGVPRTLLVGADEAAVVALPDRAPTEEGKRRR